MYELINAAEYGFEVDRPLMIVKYEEVFGRRRRVFALTIHQEEQAHEILRALNNPEPDDA